MIPDELIQLLKIPGLPDELREEITRASSELAESGAVTYPTKARIEHYLHQYREQLTVLYKDNQHIDPKNVADNREANGNTTEQSEYRKPKYFFAVFGEPDDKPKVNGGYYPHRGYISSLGMMPGDVMLLYCSGFYAKHYMEAPGIGIVLNTTEECVYYQYFPVEPPVSWYTVKESLKNYSNRLQNLSLKGNWLFEIDKTSFQNAVHGARIAWP